MAWMKYFRIISISALLLHANCNVMRRNSELLLSHGSAEDGDMFNDYDVKEESNHIPIHASSVLRLKDTNGNAFNGYTSTFVHHFARHALCRTVEGKTRFFLAMKSKLCKTNEKFLAQLVNVVCASNNRLLDKWVSELFDLNGDGFVDHYERNYYQTNH